MEKKAKIIATLGPAIYSDTKLKQLINLGVDAFRINFSHNTDGINKIVTKIRKIEKSANKKIALIADLQGVKLRVGKIKDNSFSQTVVIHICVQGWRSGFRPNLKYRYIKYLSIILTFMLQEKS